MRTISHNKKALIIFWDSVCNSVSRILLKNLDVSVLIWFHCEIKFYFVACNSHEKSFPLNFELHTYFQSHFFSFLKHILLPCFIRALQIQFGSFVISFNLYRDIENWTWIQNLGIQTKLAEHWIKYYVSSLTKRPQT